MTTVTPIPCRGLKCRETGDCLAQPAGASERPALRGEVDDLEAIGLREVVRSHAADASRCGARPELWQRRLEILR